MRLRRGMALVGAAVAAVLMVTGISGIARASTAAQGARWPRRSAGPTSAAIYEGGGRVLNAGHPGSVVAYHPYDMAPIYGLGRIS